MGSKVIRDKTIRDSIPRSQSLARCTKEAALAWPYFLMLGDDHGRFEIDFEVIKSTLFPKRKDITVEDVENWLDEYYRWGMVFRWHVVDGTGSKEYGFFVNHHKHCAISESRRHVSTIPEPDPQAVLDYLDEVHARLSGKVKEEEEDGRPF